MQQNSILESNITFYIGNADIINKMSVVSPLQPFSDTVLAFFEALSRSLIKCRDYSDVATFGFWCRKASLLQEKKQYDDLDKRIGKGIVFHSTPSNVAVNFAYSFAAGLLAGNANIVRLPAKEFPQIDIICDAMGKLLKTEYQCLSDYIVMLKYASVQETHDWLTSLCHTRVIWGGDDTIARIRKAPLNARAADITFADRFSMAVINADEYLREPDKSKLARDFYNDTYLTDQNACTSPKIIIWLGDDQEKGKAEFWRQAHTIIKEKYDFKPVQATGKLAAAYKAAAEIEDLRIIKSEDGLITRLRVPALCDDALTRLNYNSGFFFEYDAKNLYDILPLLNESCQTLIYYGVSKEEICHFIFTSQPKGIDRVVPIGKSMDFSLVWDGMDLIRGMSRKVSIV